MVGTIATQISLTNAAQPASESVITSTPYQTELFKGLAGLGLPLLVCDRQLLTGKDKGISASFGEGSDSCIARVTL